MIFENEGKYKDAVKKGINWLLSEQSPDGSMQPKTKGPVAFYKVPRALALAGRIQEAISMLEWVKRESFTENGDFTGKSGVFHESHWIYANCWFVWATHVLSKFDISYPAMSYLLSHRNPYTGGYCSKEPYAKGNGEIDILTTAFTSFIGLHLGKIDEAKNAVKFLKRIVEIQPDIKNKMFLRTNCNGELITEIPQDDPEPRHYVVDTKLPGQFYYFIGAAMVFLSKFYLITKDDIVLNLAKSYFNFATRCHPDVYKTDASGKVGLGSSYLYQITGDKQFLETAEKVANFLVNDQHKDGYWVRDGKPTPSSTAEFCVWLTEIYCGLNTKK